MLLTFTRRALSFLVTSLAGGEGGGGDIIQLEDPTTRCTNASTEQRPNETNWWPMFAACACIVILFYREDLAIIIDGRRLALFTREAALEAARNIN